MPGTTLGPQIRVLFLLICSGENGKKNNPRVNTSVSKMLANCTNFGSLEYSGLL